MKKLVAILAVSICTQAFAGVDKVEFCSKLKEAKSKPNQILIVIDSAQAVRMEVFSIDPSKPLGQIFADNSKPSKDISEMEFKTTQHNISYDYINYGGTDLNSNGHIDENEKIARMINMFNGVRNKDVVSYNEIIVGKDGLPEPKHYEDKSGYWGFKNYSSVDGSWKMEKKNGMDNKSIETGSAYEFAYPISRELEPVICN